MTQVVAAAQQRFKMDVSVVLQAQMSYKEVNVNVHEEIIILRVLVQLVQYQDVLHVLMTTHVKDAHQVWA